MSSSVLPINLNTPSVPTTLGAPGRQSFPAGLSKSSNPLNMPIIILSSPLPQTPPLRLAPPSHGFRHFVSNTLSIVIGILLALTLIVAIPFALLRRSGLLKNNELMKNIRYLPRLLQQMVQLGRISQKQKLNEQIAWLGDLGQQLKAAGLKENMLKLNQYLNLGTKQLARAHENGLLDPERADQLGRKLNNGWLGWFLGMNR
jgi:hypothetical protein